MSLTKRSASSIPLISCLISIWIIAVTAVFLMGIIFLQYQKILTSPLIQQLFSLFGIHP
jgi:hypothetical protein